MTRLSRRAILEKFATYGRDRSGWLVGAEFERHLLLPNGRPLTFSEEGGVEWLIGEFVKEGWRPEHEREHLIAAWDDPASITLEPGCQFELSGAPHRTVNEALDEALRFTRRVDHHLAAAGHGAKQVAIGFTPFVSIQDIPWVPKGRYVQMREFLIQFGDLAHHMMKGTCAIQASYDFMNEADCAHKMQLSSRLAPLTTAMFANSPWLEGKNSGYMSFRGHIWTRTDPARTGMPADREFTFESWIDYLLDVPMMFIKRGKGYVSGQGRTFRDWMKLGIDGDFPRWDDWDLHMTSVFPEVRVKKQIEVRGADCVPNDLAASFAALWEGLFYCTVALSDAEALADQFIQHGTKEERFEQACRHGLQGDVGGRPMLDWAKDLTALAGRALTDCVPSDRHLLQPLEALLDSGQSLARTHLRALGDSPTPQALIERTHPLK
ncbi:MAG: glutamate--cysteine ligase [Kiritimatiellia bacterium]|jgi:glutamate--cysteine ligase